MPGLPTASYAAAGRLTLEVVAVVSVILVAAVAAVVVAVAQPSARYTHGRVALELTRTACLIFCTDTQFDRNVSLCYIWPSVLRHASGRASGL